MARWTKGKTKQLGEEMKSLCLKIVVVVVVVTLYYKVARETSIYKSYKMHSVRNSQFH